MNDDTIRATIFRQIRHIAPDTDPESLAPGDNIQDALSIDSFDFLNVLIGISAELGVEVPEADYGKVLTLHDMVEYIGARLPVGAASAP